MEEFQRESGKKATIQDYRIPKNYFIGPKKKQKRNQQIDADGSPWSYEQQRENLKTMLDHSLKDFKVDFEMSRTTKSFLKTNRTFGEPGKPLKAQAVPSNLYTQSNKDIQRLYKINPKKRLLFELSAKDKVSTSRTELSDAHQDTCEGTQLFQKERAKSSSDYEEKSGSLTQRQLNYNVKRLSAQDNSCQSERHTSNKKAYLGLEAFHSPKGKPAPVGNRKLSSRTIIGDTSPPLTTILNSGPGKSEKIESLAYTLASPRYSSHKKLRLLTAPSIASLSSPHPHPQSSTKKLPVLGHKTRTKSKTKAKLKLQEEEISPEEVFSAVRDIKGMLRAE